MRELKNKKKFKRPASNEEALLKNYNSTLK